VETHGSAACYVLTKAENFPQLPEIFADKTNIVHIGYTSPGSAGVPACAPQIMGITQGGYNEHNENYITA